MSRSTYKVRVLLVDDKVDARDLLRQETPCHDARHATTNDHHPELSRFIHEPVDQVDSRLWIFRVSVGRQRLGTRSIIVLNSSGAVDTKFASVRDNGNIARDGVDVHSYGCHRSLSSLLVRLILGRLSRRGNSE